MDNKKELMTLNTSRLLKIVFCFLVVFHHVITFESPFSKLVLASIGPLAVGGFLFLSSYGIMKRYQEDGESYLKNLITKRIPSTYGILLGTDLIYFIEQVSLGTEFKGPLSVIASIIYIPFAKDFVYLSNWIYFIADLLIYYILFWLFMKLFKKNKENKTILAFIILNVILIIILSIINAKTFSDRYMRASTVFILGLIFAKYEPKICQLLDKKKVVIISSFLGTFMFLYIFVKFQFIREYIMPIPFIAGICALFYGIDPKGKILKPASRMTLYVYIYQELFFEIFKLLDGDINRLLLFVIVISCSIILGILTEFGIESLRYNGDRNKNILHINK